MSRSPSVLAPAPADAERGRSERPRTTAIAAADPALLEKLPSGDWFHTTSKYVFPSSSERKCVSDETDLSRTTSLLMENGPMGKVFDSIEEPLATWMTSQRLSSSPRHRSRAVDW